MKLDEESLPPMPEWTTYTDADGPSWSALRVREAMLTAMRAGALAALDEAAQECERRSVKHWDMYKTGPSPMRADSRIEAASDEADECAIVIRRLRDTIAKGESE